MNATLRAEISFLVRQAYALGQIDGETCFHALIDITLF